MLDPYDDMQPQQYPYPQQQSPDYAPPPLMGEDPEALIRALRGQQQQGRFDALSGVQQISDMGKRQEQSASGIAEGLIKSRDSGYRSGGSGRTFAPDRNKTARPYVLNSDKTAPPVMIVQRGNDFFKAGTDTPVDMGLYSPFKQYKGEEVEHWLDPDGNPVKLINDKGTGRMVYADGKQPVGDMTGFKMSRADKPYNTTSHQERTDAAESMNNLSILADVVGSFKTEYAAEEGELPFLNEAKTALGKMFPTIAKEEYVIAADWWKNKKRFIDMIERHKMFGSALTTQELKNWADSNISEKNTASQVRGLLKKLYKKASDKVRRQRDTLATGDFSTEQINTLYGGLDELDERIMPKPKPNAAALERYHADPEGEAKNFEAAFGFLPQSRSQ